MKAGAAVREINPKKPMFLVGYPHVQRISTGIHDPLLVSALCLENHFVRLVMISIDILFIDALTSRQLREQVAVATVTRPENVFISCTHTHSAPVATKLLVWCADPTVPEPDPDYMQWFCSQVVEAAQAACGSMVDASLAWTTANGRGVGGNRLSREGACDPEVGVLAVRDDSPNRLLALSLVYSMHPTVLHEDSTLVSADFPAFTRQMLQERYGPELVVLYHTGPSGNQSPRYFVDDQTFDESERLGRQLGQGVLDSLEAMRNEDFSADPPIQSAFGEVDLPLRCFPSVEEAEAKQNMAKETFERLKAEGQEHGIVRTAECAVFGAEKLLTLARAQANGGIEATVRQMMPAPVQVFQIGSACLIGFPGELFVEYGLAVKSKAPQKAFVASLVNGHLEGYIVTPEADALGGYEAHGSMFTPEAGTLLVEKALALISLLTDQAESVASPE